jgi:hypothetical protein
MLTSSNDKYNMEDYFIKRKNQNNMKNNNNN